MIRHPTICIMYMEETEACLLHQVYQVQCMRKIDLQPSDAVRQAHERITLQQIQDLSFCFNPESLYSKTVNSVMFSWIEMKPLCKLK